MFLGPFSINSGPLQNMQETVYGAQHSDRVQKVSAKLAGSPFPPPQWKSAMHNSDFRFELDSLPGPWKS